MTRHHHPGQGERVGGAGELAGELFGLGVQHMQGRWDEAEQAWRDAVAKNESGARSSLASFLRARDQ